MSCDLEENSDPREKGDGWVSCTTVNCFIDDCFNCFFCLLISELKGRSLFNLIKNVESLLMTYILVTSLDTWPAQKVKGVSLHK